MFGLSNKSKLLRTEKRKFFQGRLITTQTSLTSGEANGIPRRINVSARPCTPVPIGL